MAQSSLGEPAGFGEASVVAAKRVAARATGAVCSMAA